MFSGICEILQNPITNDSINIEKNIRNKENLIHNFKLPIQYLDKSQLYSLSDTVSNDLELISVENEKQKSMYHYLFKPTHEFAEKLIPEWKKYYTTNIDYLNDTKSVIENMETLHSKTHAYALDCSKIKEIWMETKCNAEFLPKYNYIEWDMIKHFNQSPKLLQLLSYVQLSSPLISFILPFMLLFFPFIILKFQGIPITFHGYVEVLKSIAKHHFIGKALSTGMGQMSFDKIIYLVVMGGFYILQIYQNISMCSKMYHNMKSINEHLCLIRNYMKHSIHKMGNFVSINKEYTCYSAFCKDISQHANTLQHFYTLIENIEPFGITFKKVNEIGYLLKCYYELYSNKDYEEALLFSFGFEGYINNLSGVSENLRDNVVSYARFDVSGNCKLDKQYYPPLMNENPVKNDCSFDKNMIISSPNAGGKTTMIKTTTINIIFTQQLGCGFYQSCVINPYTHIHSYLNIPDTSGRDSLFQAESRRCKEILDIIQESKPDSRHFCIFDELYSGTNPKEATKSAYAFLLYLAKFSHVNFMLTTHYVEICKKFKKSNCIENYKMNVEILENGALKYTYKLKRGVSKIQGAIKILEQMNYPSEIINSVKNYSQNKM